MQLQFSDTRADSSREVVVTVRDAQGNLLVAPARWSSALLLQQPPPGPARPRRAETTQGLCRQAAQALKKPEIRTSPEQAGDKEG